MQLGVSKTAIAKLTGVSRTILFAPFAEVERDLISENAREGLAGGHEKIHP